MRQRVTLGVDTHADIHVVCALDHLGRVLGTISVPATLAGYRELLSWASSLGDLRVAGVEGTGSYGAGLSRFLTFAGVQVLEVHRPDRQHRRRHGKSDPTDAESAARSVQSRTSLGLAKSSLGSVEALRVLKAARRSALKSRIQAANQLRSFLVTAPDPLRSCHLRLPTPVLVTRASRFRISSTLVPELSATKLALRSVARRYLSLSTEISVLEEAIEELVSAAAPQLLARPGVGVDTAASLLVAAGSNPLRLSTESSFAHLCGAAPVAASSGKTVRHRLNRGGNRDANRALHVIALVRMSSDPRTRTYVARRTSEGKSKKEIMRCLKRYIAREVYRAIIFSPEGQTSVDKI